MAGLSIDLCMIKFELFEFFNLEFYDELTISNQDETSQDRRRTMTVIKLIRKQKGKIRHILSQSQFIQI